MARNTEKMRFRQEAQLAIEEENLHKCKGCWLDWDTAEEQEEKWSDWDIAEEPRHVCSIDDMKIVIRNIGTSSAYPDSMHNKWYVCASVVAIDGDPVYRYLHPDGTWHKTSFNYSSGQEVGYALMKYVPPDFSLSDFDLDCRAMMREDLEWESRDYDFDP